MTASSTLCLADHAATCLRNCDRGSVVVKSLFTPASAAVLSEADGRTNLKRFDCRRRKASIARASCASVSAKNPFHRSACGDAQRIKHWAQVYTQGSKYQTNTNQFQTPAWKTRGVQPQEKFSTPPKVPPQVQLWDTFTKLFTTTSKASEVPKAGMFAQQQLSSRTAPTPR